LSTKNKNVYTLLQWLDMLEVKGVIWQFVYRVVWCELQHRLTYYESYLKYFSLQSCPLITVETNYFSIGFNLCTCTTCATELMFIILHNWLTFNSELNFCSLLLVTHEKRKIRDTWHSFLHVACDVEIGTVHYIISCGLAVNTTDLLHLFL
jgi:hypothetical protein